MIAAIATLFALGCLHSLGPDHLAAIAALTARGGRASVWSTGARFGAGHAGILLAAALAARLAGWVMPASVEAALGRVGGLVLIALGVATLLKAISRDVIVHRHEHEHGADQHAHVHAHLHGEAGHSHGHGALALGALFGASGLRMVAVVLPAAVGTGPLGAIGPAIAFGVGVALSMGVFGLLAAAALRAAARATVAFRIAQAAAGVAGVALGVAFAVGAMT